MSLKSNGRNTHFKLSTKSDAELAAMHAESLKMLDEQVDARRRKARVEMFRAIGDERIRRQVAQARLAA
jgi:hypothetical protein